MNRKLNGRTERTENLKNVGFERTHSGLEPLEERRMMSAAPALAAHGAVISQAAAKFNLPILRATVHHHRAGRRPVTPVIRHHHHVHHRDVRPTPVRPVTPVAPPPIAPPPVTTTPVAPPPPAPLVLLPTPQGLTAQLGSTVAVGQDMSIEDQRYELPDMPAYVDRLTTVQLTWSPVESAASYNVYRSTGSTNHFVLLGNTSAASYTDGSVSSATTSVAGNVQYHYKVTAVDGSGHESAPQASSVAVTTPPVIYFIDGRDIGFSSTTQAVINEYAANGIDVHCLQFTYLANPITEGYSEPGGELPSLLSLLPTTGPLVLTGFSFGGDSAVAVCNQLASVDPDRTVNYLGLMDPVHGWQSTVQRGNDNPFSVGANVAEAEDWYMPQEDQSSTYFGSGLLPTGPVISSSGAPVANHTSDSNHSSSWQWHGQVVFDSDVVTQVAAVTRGVFGLGPVVGV